MTCSFAINIDNINKKILENKVCKLLNYTPYYLKLYYCR